MQNKLQLQSYEHIGSLQAWTSDSHDEKAGLTYCSAHEELKQNA